jgi:hypothetical protein
MIGPWGDYGCAFAIEGFRYPEEKLLLLGYPMDQPEVNKHLPEIQLVYLLVLQSRIEPYSFSFYSP